MRTLLVSSLALLTLATAFTLLPTASAACSIPAYASETASNVQYPVNQDARIFGDHAGAVTSGAATFGNAAVAAGARFVGRQGQIATAFVAEAPGNPSGAATQAFGREISATGVELLPALTGSAGTFLAPHPAASVKAASDGVSVWGQAIAWQQADTMACL